MEKLLALPVKTQLSFSFEWANMQAKRWRARAICQHFPVNLITHEEIVSLIAELWCNIVEKKLISLRAAPGQSMQDCVEAYVAGCIDREIARSLREENALMGVCFPKNSASPIQSVMSMDEFESSPFDTDENADPFERVAIHEQMEIHAWAGNVGATIEHFTDMARSMTVREARKRRARIFAKNGSRPNLAWAVVQSCAHIQIQSARELSPMMTARWIDEANGSIMALRRKFYPMLDRSPEKTAIIAKHESRALLRWLSRFSGNETGVTELHLQIVSQDAAVAMTNWVGERGKYAKKQTEKILLEETAEENAA